MAEFRLGLDDRAFLIAFKDAGSRIARGATRAMRAVGDDVKARGVADIKAAGFGKRWQSALSVRVYPQRGTAIDPACVVVHRIPFSSVFEDGGDVTGKGLLWLPTKAAYRYLPRGTLPTPQRFIRAGYRLRSVNRPGHPPLLVVVGGKGVAREVVFHGRKTVTIQKRLHLNQICAEASARLPQFYEEAMRADG
ncbi:MAG: DUF6441 family protein [Alsobacter sp.]